MAKNPEDPTGHASPPESRWSKPHPNPLGSSAGARDATNAASVEGSSRIGLGIIALIAGIALYWIAIWYLSVERMSGPSALTYLLFALATAIVLAGWVLARRVPGEARHRAWSPGLRRRGA